MSSLIDLKNIENRIFTIRGKQVMLDSHLAELYTIETKNLNKAVKRNIQRFPEKYMFQLSDEEWLNLRFQIGTSSLEHGGRRFTPYVFTEYGIAMLPSVLNSYIAITISLNIIDTFVEIRKIINQKGFTNLRIDKLEQNQLITNQKIEQLFQALENKELKPEKGIFFDGEIFDAYIFVNDLIRKAKTSIRLIDNYVDETVLTMFSKKEKNVMVTIYTKSISKQLQLDVSKFNAQYPKMEIKTLNDSHDRFLIIDEKELYHIGASIKDLGKKWFAFSKMDPESLKILNRLN